MNQQITKKLDNIFSKYIRKKAAGFNEMCICPICNIWGYWKNMTVAHYFKRRYLQTRWLESNVVESCANCNSKDEYDAATHEKIKRLLLHRYGYEQFVENERIHKQEANFSNSDGLEMIAEFKRKLEELK